MFSAGFCPNGYVKLILWICETFQLACQITATTFSISPFMKHCNLILFFFVFYTIWVDPGVITAELLQVCCSYWRSRFYGTSSHVSCVTRPILGTMWTLQGFYLISYMIGAVNLIWWYLVWCLWVTTTWKVALILYGSLATLNTLHTEAHRLYRSTDGDLFPNGPAFRWSCHPSHLWSRPSPALIGLNCCSPCSQRCSMSVK